jgi:hypothetical protein
MTTLDLRIKERIALYEQENEAQKLRQLGRMLFAHAMRCEYGSDEMEQPQPPRKEALDIIKELLEEVNTQMTLLEEKRDAKCPEIRRGDTEQLQILAKGARELELEWKQLCAQRATLQYLIRQIQ